MTEPAAPSYTAFTGDTLLAQGILPKVVQVVSTAAAPCLVFDDATGRVVDLDPRHPLAPPPTETTEGPRGRGRPKLGVIAREVTLLPRQWEWLAAQPGGASAVLRRLVDEARRAGRVQEARRAAQEAAYRVMLALAGDKPGYEDATRALFADDRAGLESRIAAWPGDIRAYVMALAFPDPAQVPEARRPD